jgi:four helix bundle protein
MNNLEERTFNLAVSVRGFIRKLPNNIIFGEDSRQLLRSSGSIGANYIEANESLSRKDFLMRVRISRKEAKETVYWLSIFRKSDYLNNNLEKECETLIKEATEIKLILSAIINKSS